MGRSLRRIGYKKADIFYPHCIDFYKMSSLPGCLLIPMGALV